MRTIEWLRHPIRAWRMPIAGTNPLVRNDDVLHFDTELSSWTATVVKIFMKGLALGLQE